MAEPLPARPGLDPRAALLLVLFVSVTVMSPSGLRFVLPAVGLGLGLALWEQAWRRAIGLLLAAGILALLGVALPLRWPNLLTAIVSVASLYLLRFTAALGVGAHVVATTSPARLGASLRAWRAPRPIAVTLAVMLRFFPVVASEADAVRDAMRLRGLAGTRGFLRHPVLSLERFTVPMIAASLRAGEDLSASAILRGLGSRRVPTALVPPRFGWPELALLLIVVTLAALSLYCPNPLT